MPADAFRAAAHRVADLMADYLSHVEQYPVLPDLRPGHLRAMLPASAPDGPEALDALLDDYRRLIEPNVTHWQHPGFFAYFSSSGAAPGILGEMLMGTLIANAMLWRTSPAATELEEVTVGWLREALGLPDAFDGFYTDTASTSSLICLGAARQVAVPGRDPASEGLAGGARLRVYGSTEAHSSIEKAAMTLGLGRAGLHRIPVDARYAMRPDLLAAAIREDRAAGWLPAAVVATLGTTSSTAVDPVPEISRICNDERLWLHVDAAYAGPAALLPEMGHHFTGWERADSIVINPHKWLFTPLDCSLLLSRRMPDIRAAFSLVPEYLRTLGEDRAVHDFSEYTPQLGRRFRALKIWFLVRYFGLAGLRDRIREHMRLARLFAEWVDAEPDAERLAPVPFSTVCFRWHPGGRDEIAEADGPADAHLDALNEEIMRRANATGRVFLSHTRLGGKLCLRLAVGNIRTEERHVEEAWRILRLAAREAQAAAPGFSDAHQDVIGESGSAHSGGFGPR